MAYSIYEQYKISNEVELSEDAIQTDALPALVNWLFRGYKQIITEDKQEIWNEFIREFMVCYINREIYSKKSKVFRGNIIYPMLEYKTYLENADGLWDEISATLGNITITHLANTKHNRDKARTINAETDIIHNSSDIYNENVESEKNTTDNNTNSGKKTDTLGTSVTTTYDTKDTSESTGNARVVNSDYPQSTVAATTVGNPDIQSWTYASAASDSNNRGNNVSAKTGNDKSVNSGTVTTDISSTDNRTVKDTEKGNATKENTKKETSGANSTKADNIKEDRLTDLNETTNQQIIDDFSLVTKKIEFWKEHKLTCIDFLVKQYEKYFISEYVSEDRDGYIDWIGYSNLLKYLNS